MSWKLLLLLLVLPFVLAAQQDIYDEWSNLLENSVSENINSNISYNAVDYISISDNPKYPLLIELLADFDISSLNTGKDKLAFWINAYNIAAVKTIIDNKRPASIKKISTIIKSVWRQEYLKIGAKYYSMSEIEHHILRKMDEPLIHFGIVCASLSCPDLLPKAYYPKTVIMQLRENTRSFLRNETKGMKIVKTRKLIYISPIFKWFKSDFNGKRGLIKFLEMYSPYELSEYDIRYLDYNWQLNSP